MGKHCEAATISCLGTVPQAAVSFFFLIFVTASKHLNGGVAVKVTVFWAVMPSGLIRGWSEKFSA